jgi:hypothetical protein
MKWRKSSYSSDSACCVEVAQVGRRVLIRDSKDPDGPKLAVSRAAFRAFVEFAKTSE